MFTPQDILSIKLETHYIFWITEDHWWELLISVLLPKYCSSSALKHPCTWFHIIGGRGGGGENKYRRQRRRSKSIRFNVAHKSRSYHLLKIAKQLFSKINVRRNEKLCFMNLIYVYMLKGVLLDTYDRQHFSIFVGFSHVSKNFL